MGSSVAIPNLGGAILTLRVNATKATAPRLASLVASRGAD
jgi:hypothetical protein